MAAPIKRGETYKRVNPESIATWLIMHEELFKPYRIGTAKGFKQIKDQEFKKLMIKARDYLGYSTGTSLQWIHNKLKTVYSRLHNYRK